jgi:hypothetical protein
MSDTPDRPSDLSHIFGEFLVKRQLGEPPILDEYCERFPDLAEQLRLHVHLCDALGEAGSGRDLRNSTNDLDDSVALALDVSALPADARMYQLLDKLIDQESSPEKVCRSCPELLPEVRARWQRMCRVRAELEALFPPGSGPATGGPPRQESGILPRVTGYEVEAVLGQGGVGVVFRARNLRLGRPVALKMLLAGAYAGPTELARFQREAEAVASLSHANIVQIYEVGDHEGRPYFTMELVDGGSLAQKLTATPPAVRRAAELVASLADAMAVAHGAGIVHRDLKPANVLLTADGTPKIGDFGLARRLEGQDGLTRSGTAVGTPSYMAPEQASGAAGPVGPSADVYGLGAVLYELLTGRPPFRGGTALETFRQVLTDEPVPPSRLNPRVPRDLETVCLKCLQKEPQWRYSGAAALAEDLRRYLHGQVVVARPVGRLERAGKWIRRNPVVASLTAAVVSAMVVGTVAASLLAMKANQKEKLATERAGELEQKTDELVHQAIELKDEKEKVTRALISGWLLTIGRNPAQLNSIDPAEADAVRHIRDTPAPIRLEFLETALRDLDAAQRVGRRADWIMHAIVGCDRVLRAEVGQRVIRRIQEPGAPREVALACARLGLSVNIKDRAWAERSAAAVIVALRDPTAEREGYLRLAETLATVSEQLSPTQAADHATQALDVFLTLLREKHEHVINYDQLGRAIVVISPWMDVDAVTRAAEALGAGLRKTASYPTAWEPLVKTLAAVCQRLPASNAAAQVNRTVDWILENHRTTPERNKVHYYFHARALLLLCGRIDADRAARVANVILAILGDSEKIGNEKIGFIETKFITRSGFAEVLTAVAERLDASSNLRAAEELILLLWKTKANDLALGDEQFRIALVSVCRRLDGAGAARVAEAVVDAVRDPKTTTAVRMVFASVLAAIGAQLTPNQADSLESALVDSLLATLADAKSSYPGESMGQALTSVCGGPGARCTPRVADALSGAIRNPQASPALLPPLMVALVTVSGQLPPKEAAAHVNQAATVLDSLGSATTKSLDRALIAEAQATAWTRLTPAEAAVHARKVAVDLGDRFRDSKVGTAEHHALAHALVAVCGHLDPTERSAHLTPAANILLAALRQSKNDLNLILHWGTLATFCVHLDRPGIAQVIDAFLHLMSDVDMQSFLNVSSEDVLKKIAARLDEADLLRLLEHPVVPGRLRRVVLDVLGGAKNCSFRNTWDYLDWIESKVNGVAPPKSTH